MSSNSVILPLVQPQRLVQEDCCVCGVVFAIPDRLREQRTYDGQSFFCPNGHSMVFKNSEKQCLQRELKAAQDRADREAYWKEHARQRAAALERSRNAVRGVVTRMRKRVGAGCCPCCKRHFENLQRHIATKHPHFTPKARKKAP